MTGLPQCDDLGVLVTKARGGKCPRCWKFTGEGRFNFDGLCDPCQQVIVLDYPDHESVQGIQAALAKQREQFRRST